MVKKLNFKNTFIRFNEVGDRNNETIVLLHGYLESLEVWNDIANTLSEEYHVVCPDLPSHGETMNTEDVQTMDTMAEPVNLLLDRLKVDSCYMFGHSMGGYVTLAFAEAYPDKLKGYSLVHSHAKPDSEDKKKARDDQIQMLQEERKEEIVENHVPNVFAKDNVEPFKDKIEELKEIARKTPDQGIIAAIKGMKERPDRSHILQETNLPVLFVIGKKDNIIPNEVYEEQAKLSDRIERLDLENSGHMGFIEEKDQFLSKMKEFISQ